MSNQEIKENMRKLLEDDAYLTHISKKSFDRADKNHNGTIDIKELKACMIDIAQGLGKAIPDKDAIKNEFFNLDKDGNKTIDFEEFKLFIKKNILTIIDGIPD